MITCDYDSRLHKWCKYCKVGGVLVPEPSEPVITGGPNFEYNRAHATLVAYLKQKVEEADWHGVSDAANDLRVMEAKR